MERGSSRSELKPCFFNLVRRVFSKSPRRRAWERGFCCPTSFPRLCQTKRGKPWKRGCLLGSLLMDNTDQFHSDSTVGLFTQFQGQIWASLRKFKWNNRKNSWEVTCNGLGRCNPSRWTIIYLVQLKLDRSMHSVKNRKERSVLLPILPFCTMIIFFKCDIISENLFHPFFLLHCLIDYLFGVFQ